VCVIDSHSRAFISTGSQRIYLLFRILMRSNGHNRFRANQGSFAFDTTHTTATPANYKYSCHRPISVIRLRLFSSFCRLPAKYLILNSFTVMLDKSQQGNRAHLCSFHVWRKVFGCNFWRVARIQEIVRYYRHVATYRHL